MNTQQQESLAPTALESIPDDAIKAHYWFQFCIIRGSGHTSIWLGPVLITLDWFGYEHLGLPLLSLNWRPD